MIYVVMFDFGLAALLVAVLGFLVLCWFGFRKERMRQPMYGKFAIPVAYNAAATAVRKQCA
jgi:hypothetical protein